MTSTESPLHQYILMQHLPGMVLHRKHQLLADGYSMSELLHSKPFQEYIVEWGKNNLAQALRWAAEEEQRATHLGMNIISIADPRYPSLLLEIDDPPFVIYTKGQLSLLEQMNRPVAVFGIVGARKVTPYGVEAAKLFSRELLAAGFILVSGMAMGIDAVVHDEALKQSDDKVVPTIGFVGCGLDQIYPAATVADRRRYEEMGRRALLMSEFPLGYPPLAANFPRRNRLISGASYGVLVVQAAEQSGSLITARLAAEQGRLVFAVPHPITSSAGAGGNQLIRLGVTLVSQASEIIEEVSKQVNLDLPSTEKNTMSDPLAGCGNLNSEEKILYNLLMQNQTASPTAEELMVAGGLAPQIVLQGLSGLELRGLIQKTSDGRFQRRS